jgi:outer membrane protein TolC
MGDVSVTDMRDLMFNLTDDFNIEPLDIPAFEKQFDQYFDYSLFYSYDIQASTLLQTAAGLTLKGADNNCLPQLNLTGTVANTDFTNLNESKKIYSSLEMKQPQAVWTVGVNLNVPLYNDSALGVFEQARANYATAMLNTQLLQQQRLEALRLALSQHINIALSLVEADKNVEISMKVFSNSGKQFQAGLSTLFDLLSYETTLTNSLLNRTSLRVAYMQNIALIRFLTASVFLQGENNNCIQILDITTLPEFNLRISDRPKVSETMENFLQRRNKVWKKR